MSGPDFRRMTPAELNAKVEACDEREKTIWFRHAWFTATLLLPHLKRGRRLDPMKLLPSWMRKRKKPKTKKEVRLELDEIKKELKIE